MRILGFDIERSKNKDDYVDENKLVDDLDGMSSFLPPHTKNESQDIEVYEGINGGGTMQPYLYDTSVDFNAQKNKIEHYRQMACHPEVDEAISHIVNDAIVVDERKAPISLVLDDVELSDNIKEKIKEEFDYFLHLIDFTNNAYEYFRDWYVDNGIGWHMIPSKNKKEIVDVRRLDPANTKFVREIIKEKNQIGIETIKGVKEYYIYRNEMPQSGQHAFIKVSKDSIIYVDGGYYDKKRQHKNGHLHKAIKPLNDLVAVENAAVIYRLARAPERRVFYIDIGNMPKNRGEAYMKRMMNKHKRKIVYDGVSGAVNNSSHHMSIMEDIWLPRRGDRGTQIDTLQGGQNLGEIDDIMYFQKKLYRSLNVPSTRLESDNIVQFGRVAEITRDELKFTKFIDRLRANFSEIFTQFLRVQLQIKNIVSNDDWETKIKNRIRYDFAEDFYLSEQKEVEIFSDRAQVLQIIDPYVGKYFTMEEIQKNVLRRTDDEYDQFKKQVDDEIKQGVIKNPEDDDNNFGY